MTCSRSTILAVALAAAAGTTPPVSAAIRPWEPSDYVTNGLVLHYDGIRNAGLAVAHDNAATTWVDLSGYGRDATLTAGSGSAWKDDGFHFAKTAWFQTSATFSLGSTCTIQVIADFKKSDVSGNAMFVAPNGGIAKGAIWWKNGDGNIFYRGDDSFGTAWNACPGISKPTTAKYLTALRDGNRAALTTGTAHPTTEGTTGQANSIIDWFVGSKNVAYPEETWFVGAKNARGEEPLAGDIKSVRLYTVLLTDAQLAWNRAVDEARFFGATTITAAPVAGAIPNAVIATSVTGAEGLEASGCYVVDADGHTFRASPFATVSGAGYVCTGYTLAAWDATLGAYGAAVAHDGEFACLVSAGDKVRITWQWASAGGSLGSDVAGYVADNLLYHFDGIRNAGADRPHDPTALSWANLANRSSDVTLYHKTSSDCAQGFGDGDFAGEWAKDGFIFRGTNFFYKGGAWTMPADATLQLVADIRTWEQESNIPFVFGETDSAKRSGGLTLNRGAGRLDFYCDGQLGCDYNSRPRMTPSPFTYATAVITGNKAAVFPGTAIPSDSNTAANNGGWFIQTDESKVKGAFSNDRFVIGGGVNWSGTYMVGTVKAIRLYGGVLTDSQLAWNRALDEARFFGNGAPASNAVVVTSSIAGLEGREVSGIYFPDAWTFSAGAGTQTVRDIDWQCAGYQLQTWDAVSGTWNAASAHNSASYTSPSAATPFASVRLTWLWKPVSGIRTAADYVLADYATGAMQLHLDGKEHGSSATVWSDLSGHGRDATLNAASGATGNAWVSDGYQFNANADFATSKSFALGRSATVQVLADAPTTSQPKGFGTFVSPVGAQPKSGTLLYKKTNDYILFQADDLNWVGDANAWQSRTTIERPSAPITYMTALRDGSRTALFTGTAYPENAANDRNGQALRGWAYGPVDLVAAASPWTVGGYRNASNAAQADYWLSGTIKSVRLYDRMLTEDELAWNRSVDNARYFGVLTTTNVVVVANEFSGNLADAYEVFGSHTFTASPSAQSRAADHVRVRHLQPNGTWGATYLVRSPSYTYTPGDGTVQIEFRKTKAFMLILK